MADHILSLSYGKDSMACLFAIEQLGWSLDRIVTADVYATDTISADLPSMVEFKAYADKEIKRRWGIDVEHLYATKNGEKLTYEKLFYHVPERKTDNPNCGECTGFPYHVGPWCNTKLKVRAMGDYIQNRDLVQEAAQRSKDNAEIVQYLGIAADEPERIARYRKPGFVLPLVEVGWTESECRKICMENNLLSPIYTTATRGGCWFCHNQGLDQLRLLRENSPELWALLLKWDLDSPVSFKPDGHTVHDFDRRFAMEEKALIPTDKTFRWKMLDVQPRFVPLIGEQLKMF